MAKGVVKNALIYGIAPQITRVLSVIVLPFITPYLTKVDYGIAGVISSVTAGLSVFSNLGLTYVLMLYYYKSPIQYKWIWREIYGFIRIWQIFFIGLQSIILYLLIPIEAKDNFYKIAGILALPYFFFSGASFIGYNLFRYKEMVWSIALRSVIGGSIVVCLNIITIVYLGLGYLGWFIAMAVSDIVIAASYYFPLRYKYKLSPIYFFKIKTIQKSLKSAFPLLPHYYSIYLLDTSDRLMMKLLQLPTALIGTYNIASNFGAYFSAFHMAIGQAVGPNIFASLKSDNHHEIKKTIKGYFIVTVLLSFTFSCWSKEIFNLLFRNNDLSSSYIFSIGIVMAYAYRPYYVLVNQYLSFNERVKFLPYFTFGPGVVNVILNLILLPHIGIQGAVLSTFIAYSLMGFVPFIFPFVRKLVKLNYSALLAVLLIITFTALAYLIVDLNIIAKAGMYLIGLIILSLFYLKK